MVTGSIVIPVLNESDNIGVLLSRLQPLKQAGWKLIVVDGGSTDDTVAQATSMAATVLESSPGRATQMNMGASRSEGEVLLFLHADTQLPADAEIALAAFSKSQYQWGRFDVQLSGTKWMFSVIAWFINWRSRLTGVATGDQALFFKRAFFLKQGGFADIPLMEDVEICKRHKAQGFLPYCSPLRVTTSSRKWEKEGTWRTIWLMWRLRFAYSRGANPEELHRKYYSC